MDTSANRKADYTTSISCHLLGKAAYVKCIICILCYDPLHIHSLLVMTDLRIQTLKSIIFGDTNLLGYDSCNQLSWSHIKSWVPNRDPWCCNALTKPSMGVQQLLCCSFFYHYFFPGRKRKIN